MTARRARSLVIVGGAFALCGVIAGCGPQTLSPASAYELCSERARQAAGPTGRVGMGVGSGGFLGDLDLTISSDFLRGRDPQIVYDSCFREATGAGPTRPLVL